MKRIKSFLANDILHIALSALLFALAIAADAIAPPEQNVSTAALSLYIITLAIAGAPVFIDALRGIIRRDFLDEKFLMSIASIGAFILGEFSEGCAVMIFFLIGEYFEHKAVARSRKSIKELMNICPDTANVLIDGEEHEADAEDVEVGSLIVIRSGERVPIDCIIVDGSSDVDTSALTGEALPRSVTVGDEIKSGTVIINGVLCAKTLRPAEESAAARILELVENASEAKSKEENFITKFSRVYTPIVVAAALLLAIVPPIFRLMPWESSVYRALIFLVISCPCALVISVPMAFFGGIGCAASRGILFKGGNIFSPLARAKTFAFDKTGTLTNGEFIVDTVVEIGASREEILSLAASAEYASNHPISKALKASAGNLRKPERAEDLSGKGARAILGTDEILVGNELLMRDNGVNLPQKLDTGIYVAKNRRLIGVVCLSDKIKEEADGALTELRALGAERLVMISGDREEKAELVKSTLSLDAAYASLLPDEKYRKLEELMSDGEKLVYVGDGINDAPSLCRADVGVAMGAIGSDSAISSADLVLMSDKLDNLPQAVKIARKTLAIAKQNIIFALGVKFAVMILGALGIANMWLAVFADVGVALLAILNSMRTLAAK